MPLILWSLERWSPMLQFAKAMFLASYGTAAQLPPCQGGEVVFAGRSNVGKSTLINKLFCRKNLARVSSTPGKTATINFYSLPPLTVVDLPGYGYAKVAKTEKGRFSKLITTYLCSGRDIRLIFLLLDMRHAPSQLDLQMIDFLVSYELPFYLVFTKADKLGKSEREERLLAFETEIPYFDQIHKTPFSSVTQEGIAALQAVLEELAGETAGAHLEETL